MKQGAFALPTASAAKLSLIRGQREAVSEAKHNADSTIQQPHMGKSAWPNPVTRSTTCGNATACPCAGHRECNEGRKINLGNLESFESCRHTFLSESELTMRKSQVEVPVSF